MCAVRARVLSHQKRQVIALNEPAHKRLDTKDRTHAHTIMAGSLGTMVGDLCSCKTPIANASSQSLLRSLVPPGVNFS